MTERRHMDTNAREIKFRMWCPWEKKMLSGVELHNAFSYTTSDTAIRVHPVADERVLMQFTGLRDKNGVEIYEGDIVRFKDFQAFREDQYDRTALVVYYCEPDDRVGFAPMVWHTEVDDAYYNSEREDYEVIGNVYENPELLGA